MKVIRVGNSSQSRIAQACDRCRSKKIRCDGVRPTCSQCANVGFECKTSDKLSRRAFPRGYTESLEERVRALENEVKDLKSLLDEKDEKIDVLSRIHSFSPSSQQKNISPNSSVPVALPKSSNTPDATEGTFKVEQPSQSADTQSSGLSSTCGFAGKSLCMYPWLSLTSLDVFKNKLVEQGKLSVNVSMGALTESPPTIPSPHANQPIKTPSRLVSDQLINIFFQEWAPLYPVVHRPTVLKAYEQYLSNLECAQRNAHDMAQLNLIFGIAALTSKVNASLSDRFVQLTAHSRERIRIPPSSKEIGPRLSSLSSAMYPCQPCNV